MPVKARKVIRKPARTRTAPATLGQVEVHPAEREVTIAPAKGRPMLTWVGKHALRHVPAFPAQHIETFDPIGDAAKRAGELWTNWPKKYPRGGLLFHGDNKEVLAHLLINGFRGKVKLIYIDPPFDSGADYVRRVTLRGPKGTAKIEGEGYALGEQIQYTDIWTNDNYLQFMYERLLLLKEILSEDGFIFLHVNHERSTFLRLLMEEVFGPENYRNTFIVEKSMGKNYYEGGEAKTINSSYDCVLLFSKDPETKMKIPTYHLEPDVVTYISETLFKKLSRYGEKLENAEEDAGGQYYWGPFDAPGIRQYLSYELLGHKPTSGRHWSWTEDRAKAAVERYRAGERLKQTIKDRKELGARLRDLAAQGVVFNPNGGRPRQKVYIDAERVISDIWADTGVNDRSEDYPTAKTPRLLRRVFDIVGPLQGALVLDAFCGSSPTLQVAQERGCRWIGCDINKGSIQTTSKRLQGIMQEQIAEGKKRGPHLVSTEQDKPQLVQLSFAVYRVNDYDLQIQHNEAVNLVCEHIGIERTRADRYFDGTLGKRLVKIIPFGHPLTPLDLEELKRELAARPDEERDVTAICLGKELAVTQWLEEWNRLRKKGDVPNKIEVIELRTDPKYGKFIAHKPAQAKVRIQRTKEKLVVEIQDFISPTIIERLKEQAGILAPQIDDWGAMVDCVMIDPAYDGKVFNIVVSDVPEKKTDFVAGRYELPALKGKTTVAVKITDMLGEEVLVVQPV